MSAFRPHPYQACAIRRIVEQPAVGLMLDMGLGKTVIALTAVRELIYERLEVGRALVIAPRKVAEATWQAEAAKWDHLRELRIQTALGTAKQREAALAAPSDLVVINRENVAWLVEHYLDGSRPGAEPTLGGRPTGRLAVPDSGAERRRSGRVAAAAPCGPTEPTFPYDMVIVDESSSFKNPASQRFRALRRALPYVRRVVILTGTPAPNGLGDLWSQVYLLDRGERLGRHVTHYRARYFDYNPWRHEYTAKPGAFEAVREKISDLCLSMSAGDWLQLPERIVRDFPVVLDAAAEKAYRKLERETVLELDDTDISVLSAAALTGKLLQLCGGAVYDAAGEAHEIHRAKLEALTELLEGLNGEGALVFYGFRHEAARIEAVLKELGLSYRVLGNAADAEMWNAGRLRVLLAHPASCAYGLNLQQGGRHVVWFTLTWSLELYQQANARLYRQGQERPVVVHRLLVKGGMDEDVARALEDKGRTQDALLAALKARIREAGA